MIAILVLGALSMIGAGIVLVVLGRRDYRANRNAVIERPGTRDVALGIVTIVLGGVVLVLYGLWSLLEAIGPIWGP